MEQRSDFNYLAKAFNPAHPDLARSAGMPAKLANEDYVEALARIVYYWAYPAVDIFGRTSMWENMKNGPGQMFGIVPGAPVNMSSALTDYLPPAQRIVVTPNNDTFYGVSFTDLGQDSVVIQTPVNVPKGHYWTVQITDVFTNVIYQLGSASESLGGKYLLVGPEWKGIKPEGFIDVLCSPTNYGGVFFRSFASRTDEAKATAIMVLDQIGVYPFSQNKSELRKFDYESVSQNKVFPPGVSLEMISADPDMIRPQWVVPDRFWDDLSKMLKANPNLSSSDSSMADQARALIALRETDADWKILLDKTALEADASLHTGARYEQVGVDAGNGWQRQMNGGLWGTDWFGRAQAAVIYILVNDFHEAIYFIRGTDERGNILDGRHVYTITFPKGGIPPVDRSRGGFWSLTMYDKDYFMLPHSQNGRTNIGSVSLDANELKFSADGSLTVYLSHEKPLTAEGQSNWLPAPEGQFALTMRAYVPTQPILDSTYQLPNVKRKVAEARLH